MLANVEEQYAAEVVEQAIVLVSQLWFFVLPGSQRWRRIGEVRFGKSPGKQCG